MPQTETFQIRSTCNFYCFQYQDGTSGHLGVQILTSSPPTLVSCSRRTWIWLQSSGKRLDDFDSRLWWWDTCQSLWAHSGWGEQAVKGQHQFENSERHIDRRNCSLYSSLIHAWTTFQECAPCIPQRYKNQRKVTIDAKKQGKMILNLVPENITGTWNRLLRGDLALEKVYSIFAAVATPGTYYWWATTAKEGLEVKHLTSWPWSCHETIPKTLWTRFKYCCWFSRRTT